MTEEKDSISIGWRGGRDGVYILGKRRHRTGPGMGIQACTKLMLQLGVPGGWVIEMAATTTSSAGMFIGRPALSRSAFHSKFPLL